MTPAMPLESVQEFAQPQGHVRGKRQVDWPGIQAAWVGWLSEYSGPGYFGRREWRGRQRRRTIHRTGSIRDAPEGVDVKYLEQHWAPTDLAEQDLAKIAAFAHWLQGIRNRF